MTEKSSHIPDELHSGNEFLQKVISIIQQNMGDEHFEVPDLARAMNMSRSSLLRKVKSLTGLSVSLFIRKVRVHYAREILRDESLTASEVSYKVGFNSPSYFTKCFREEFGYTPGELKNSSIAVTPVPEAARRYNLKLILPVFLLIIIASALIYFLVIKHESDPELPLEKTIAVLPFKNDSADTSNVYMINGLMQTILDNLQQIEELQVTSRTTTEKYRNSTKTIPEISGELDVNYLIEGSGQKSGDQILLSIQLIDARNDKHLWSKQYTERTDDIFKLQSEVARNIAREIQVVISPKVRQRLEKVPSENPVAYDLYLKGRDVISDRSSNGMVEGLGYFKKALEEDPTFANAYAYTAICYYYLDIYQANKMYGQDINTYADKALLYDSELPESLIAKALFYMQDEQYELAVEYFEKVLEISPNAIWVHNFLSDIYTSYLPDIEKYLTHALRGIRASVAEQDSVEASFTYLHLSNALAQSGFILEAEKYVNKSLELYPSNIYAEYLAVYIRLSKNFNLRRTKAELKEILKKDSTRLDVMQEIGKVCYTMGDYQEAWSYYAEFLRIKEELDLEIFPHEDINIAFVLSQLNMDEQASIYYEQFKSFAENDESIYHDLQLSAYYAAMNDIDSGIQHLKAFTSQKDILYWVVLMIDKDPIMNKLSEHPDYKDYIKQISENFWRQHKNRRKQLEEDGLLGKP